MQITRGKLTCPQRVIIYGPEGIGKTSLAARFPEPVFIDTEGSTRNFDVARYPVPYSWENLIQTVQHAMDTPQNQKTLVIDTADWAEKLCTEAVCDRAQKKGIEDFGYGKGYVFLKEEFAKLLTYLDGCINAGINVVLTAHAALRKVEQPDEMGSYDRWEMKLTKHCAPLVKEWADLVLFCNYKTIVVQDENKKGKAQGGRRVMYTAHHPCWDAKNRHGLPPELPMEWEAIAPIFQTGGASSNIVTGSISADQIPNVTGLSNSKPLQETLQTVANSPATNTDRLPTALLQLMANDNVTEQEIQLCCNDKGYFPVDMPVKDYPPDFINGVLIGAWPQVLQQIKKDREELPF